MTDIGNFKVDFVLIDESDKTNNIYLHLKSFRDRQNKPEKIIINSQSFFLKNLGLCVFDLRNNITQYYQKSKKNDAILIDGSNYIYATIIINNDDEITVYHTNGIAGKEEDTSQFIFQRFDITTFKSQVNNIIESLKYETTENTPLLSKWNEFTEENLNSEYQAEGNEIRFFFNIKENKFYVLKLTDNEDMFEILDADKINIKQKKIVDIDPINTFITINSIVTNVSQTKDKKAIIIKQENEGADEYKIINFDFEINNWNLGKTNESELDLIKKKLIELAGGDTSKVKISNINKTQINPPKKSFTSEGTNLPLRSSREIQTNEPSSSSKSGALPPKKETLPTLTQPTKPATSDIEQAKIYSETIRFLEKRREYLEDKIKETKQDSEKQKDLQSKLEKVRKDILDNDSKRNKLLEVIVKKNKELKVEESKKVKNAY